MAFHKPDFNPWEEEETVDECADCDCREICGQYRCPAYVSDLFQSKAAYLEWLRVQCEGDDR